MTESLIGFGDDEIFNAPSTHATHDTSPEAMQEVYNHWQALHDAENARLDALPDGSLEQNPEGVWFVKLPSGWVNAHFLLSRAYP